MPSLFKLYLNQKKMSLLSLQSKRKPKYASQEEKRQARNARKKAKDQQEAAQKREAAFYSVYPPPPDHLDPFRVPLNPIPDYLA